MSLLLTLALVIVVVACGGGKSGKEFTATKFWKLVAGNTVTEQLNEMIKELVSYSDTNAPGRPSPVVSANYTVETYAGHADRKMIVLDKLIESVKTDIRLGHFEQRNDIADILDLLRSCGDMILSPYADGILITRNIYSMKPSLVLHATCLRTTPKESGKLIRVDVGDFVAFRKRLDNMIDMKASDDFWEKVLVTFGVIAFALTCFATREWSAE